MQLRQRSLLINSLFAIAALGAGLYFFLPQTVYDFFSFDDFMPHGHCYLWRPSILWTMVITNFLIGVAYVSIAFCLYILVRRIQLPFSAMFLAFGAFIFACGGTHFVEIYNLWVPNYWLSAFINVITAIASVATAFLIFPIMPKVTEFAQTAKLSEMRKIDLEKANSELEDRTTELENLNRELEAFSYSVSHDLRAPLRGIDGFGQALLEDYSEILDDTGKKYLGYMRESTQKMGRIIDDLLNLSRLTRVELKMSMVDLSAMANEIIKNLQLNDPQRKVEVVIQDGMRAECDFGLINSVLVNLLSNAWKFSSKVAQSRIEFGAFEKEGIVYYIKDNGAGFDMAHSTKLFGAFQRLHTPQEFPGTGIGLATAKRIIQRHGGHIWAESGIDMGSTFYFQL